MTEEVKIHHELAALQAKARQDIIKNWSPECLNYLPKNPRKVTKDMVCRGNDSDDHAWNYHMQQMFYELQKSDMIIASQWVEPEPEPDPEVPELPAGTQHLAKVKAVSKQMAA